MTNKNTRFYTLTAAIFLFSTTNLKAVEMLRPEDEDLLAEQVVKSAPAPANGYEKVVFPISRKRAYSPNAPRKVEWFNPTELPTQKIEHLPAADSQVAQLKQAIKDCLNQRKDQLDLERDMLEQQTSQTNAAYLSKTIEEINLCYEDIGYKIIETYYDNDIATISAYTQKLKTFYVNGTQPSFDAGFCDKTCSMKAIIDAQMVKFAEFRLYLSKLLKERPLKG